MQLSVGRLKKCGVTDCVCNSSSMPITEILYGTQHPKNFPHSKPNDSYPQRFPLFEHMDFTAVKRISRKYPNCYKYVKELKSKNA